MNTNAVASVCIISVSSLITGCTTRQHVTRLETPKPQQVCIVQHHAVKAGVLEALQEGLTKHGMRNKVVPGVYELKHAMWQPRWNPEQVTSCDALIFYVANWSWDLALYMRFANVWMTPIDGSKKLSQATYDAGGNIGPGKFIVAREKILELVDQMIGDTGATLIVVPPTNKAGAQVRLQQLEELKKSGLISEPEYQRKRHEILNDL
jgi:hypothetical protein